MSFLLFLHAVAQIVKLHFINILFNHLLNIPLSLLVGFGKYGAFCIAVIMDVVQMIFYYNVLNNTSLGKRFHWAISEKLFKSYKKPEFMSKLHHSGIYAGVLFLSLLPVYFGGMFAAVFTAHVMKLNRTKGFVCISIGSLIGCFIWTVGIWNLIEFVIKLF
jgi:uncharacterized membrane protein